MKRKKWFKFQALTSMISCMLVLVLIGLSVLSTLTVQNISDHVREDFIITLTLGGSNDALLGSSDATGAQTTSIQESMQHERYAKEVRLITADEVLMQQLPLIGDNPVDFEGFNPYFNEVEIGLKSDYVCADSINAIVSEIQAKYPLVSEVVYEKDLVENLDVNTKKISYIMLILSILLVVVLFTLINNLVHLSIFARRFQIRTMKLVGASYGFIYRQFLGRSLGIGFAAGILASIILFGVAAWIGGCDEVVKQCISTKDLLLTSAIIIAIGIVLMTLCTLISVRHFLKMKERRMHC